MIKKYFVAFDKTSKGSYTYFADDVNAQSAEEALGKFVARNMKRSDINYRGQSYNFTTIGLLIWKIKNGCDWLASCEEQKKEKEKVVEKKNDYIQLSLFNI